MSAIGLIERAIEMVMGRRTLAPSFPIFESIEAQLRYLER